jgi:hypothetical protein
MNIRTIKSIGSLVVCWAGLRFAATGVFRK